MSNCMVLGKSWSLGAGSGDTKMTKISILFARAVTGATGGLEPELRGLGSDYGNEPLFCGIRRNNCPWPPSPAFS